ncbi:hypothetical protein [uncultured Sphingomonas sp.]|uniref:hypothetical protein n=1 Tax=uncultured Sphingomonas sp. TaxID=158754 RepID=UPI0035CBF478
MTNPLHPMHQELLRRVAMPGTPGATEWSRPARFATIFYLGLAAWALVGLATAAVIATF